MKDAAPHESLETRRKIKAALAEDARCRVPGVTDGLYALEDLKEFSRLGHGVPVIRKVDDWDNGTKDHFDRAPDVAEFERRLRAAAPFLAGFDLRAHGFCLAGGSVSALLMKSDKQRALAQQSAFHDFDLFLVGHKSDEESNAAVNMLAAHLTKAWAMHAGWFEPTVYRTQGCITFQGPNETLVQVILRRYSTLGEVIHGFDLGSSAVLWDGTRVLTTALGKIAFENGANVLNLTARRNSYERRLARYFSRGFDLVLPGLDGCALTAIGGRLPYLHAVGIKSVDGCSCSLTALELRPTAPGRDDCGHRIGDGAVDKALAQAPAETSDYGAGEIAYGNRHALTSRNARALAGRGEAPVWTASLCAFAPMGTVDNIFAIEPTVDPVALASIIRFCFNESGVKIKSLTALLGPDGAMELILNSVSNGGKTPTHEEIDRISADRCQVLNQKAHIPFAYMTVQDKTALTGPFPRALVEAKDWYGDAGGF